MDIEDTTEDRYSRQNDVVPRDRILASKVTVIGVGAIGRQVALMLASIGVPEIQLFDHDKIEEVNCVTQGFEEDDIGRYKVDSVKYRCQTINKSIMVATYESRFTSNEQIHSCVFCCVDSISTRKEIWDAVQAKTEFFVDGRMSAETLRVITASDYDSRKYYPTTLFTPEEAYQGSCTARSTIYCANVAAGIMVSQFTKFLRDYPVDADIQLNLLANEMVVTDIIPIEIDERAQADGEDETRTE